jgi:phosphatidylglycerophosphate synthase
MLRVFLDCLDGAVARKCNLKSKLGAVLDVTNDGVSGLVIFAVAMAVLWMRPYPTHLRVAVTLLFAVALISVWGAMINEWTTKDDDRGFLHGIEQFLHDNLVGFHLLAVLMYWLVFKKSYLGAKAH